MPSGGEVRGHHATGGPGPPSPREGTVEGDYRHARHEPHTKKHPGATQGPQEKVHPTAQEGGQGAAGKPAQYSGARRWSTKREEYSAGAVFYKGEGAIPFEIVTSFGRDPEFTSDTIEEGALLFTLGVYGHLSGKTRSFIIHTDFRNAVRSVYKLRATAIPTVYTPSSTRRSACTRSTARESVYDGSRGTRRSQAMTWLTPRHGAG
ncbi:unnamed protein product [Ixodes hexagonus]